MCITGSLCCAAQTSTNLYISYTPIKLKKKEKQQEQQQQNTVLQDSIGWVNSMVSGPS